MPRTNSGEEHKRIKGLEQNTQNQGKSKSHTGTKYKGPAAGKAGGNKGRKSKKAY